MPDYVPSDDEKRVIAWLRAGGTMRGCDFATVGLRLRAAWVAFKAPWAFPRAEAKRAADAIEQGTHHADH